MRQAQREDTRFIETIGALIEDDTHAVHATSVTPPKCHLSLSDMHFSLSFILFPSLLLSFLVRLVQSRPCRLYLYDSRASTRSVPLGVS